MVGAGGAVCHVFEAFLLHLKFEVMLVLVLGVGELGVDFDGGNSPSGLMHLPLRLRLLLAFVRNWPAPFLLNISGSLEPRLEYVCAAVFHVVVGEKDGGHGVEQVFVVVQVLLILD